MGNTQNVNRLDKERVYTDLDKSSTAVCIGDAVTTKIYYVNKAFLDLFRLESKSQVIDGDFEFMPLFQPHLKIQSGKIFAQIKNSMDVTDDKDRTYDSDTLMFQDSEKKELFLRISVKVAMLDNDFSFICEFFPAPNPFSDKLATDKELLKESVYEGVRLVDLRRKRVLAGLSVRITQNKKVQINNENSGWVSLLDHDAAKKFYPDKNCKDSLWSMDMHYLFIFPTVEECERFARDASVDGSADISTIFNVLVLDPDEKKYRHAKLKVRPGSVDLIFEKLGSSGNIPCKVFLHPEVPTLAKLDFGISKYVVYFLKTERRDEFIRLYTKDSASNASKKAKSALSKILSKKSQFSVELLDPNLDPYKSAVLSINSKKKKHYLSIENEFEVLENVYIELDKENPKLGFIRTRRQLILLTFKSKSDARKCKALIEKLNVETEAPKRLSPFRTEISDDIFVTAKNSFHAKLYMPKEKIFADVRISLNTDTDTLVVRDEDSKVLYEVSDYSMSAHPKKPKYLKVKSAKSKESLMLAFENEKKRAKFERSIKVLSKCQSIFTAHPAHAVLSPTEREKVLFKFLRKSVVIVSEKEGKGLRIDYSDEMDITQSDKNPKAVQINYGKGEQITLEFENDKYAREFFECVSKFRKA